MSEPTFATQVSRWYERNARDLPWRKPGIGAWAILVSEVMLQQTPVVRVVPAWEAWLARWPDPRALAEDTPAEAIRMWGRLGYPRRAVRLRECAVAIVERHGGVVPDRLDQLLALPGVGTYTARAVAAFAYGQRHPVVDTNVRGVVCRAIAGEPDAGPTTRPADLVATEELLPIEPYYALTYMVMLLVVVCVGGAGSIGGALTACLILGFVDTLARYLLPSYGAFFFYAAVILIVLVFPNGLFGRKASQ